MADELLKFIETPGGTEGILAALESYKGKNEVFDLGAEELKTVATYMQAFGVPADHFEIDLTIARGLDYYTGTVYETAMLDHPEIGSICSGGRYDNLAEYYTDKQLPGVGISIGLTRLFYVLGEQGYLNDQMNKAPAASAPSCTASRRSSSTRSATPTSWAFRSLSSSARMKLTRAWSLSRIWRAASRSRFRLTRQQSSSMTVWRRKTQAK